MTCGRRADFGTGKSAVGTWPICYKLLMVMPTIFGHLIYTQLILKQILGMAVFNRNLQSIKHGNEVDKIKQGKK